MASRTRCMALGLAVVSVLVWSVLAWSVPARAQTGVAADAMGRFLGYTVMCGCLSEEPEHLQALYYALLVEWADSSYAEAASGFMREVADNAGRYQGEDTQCWRICSNEFVVTLEDTMAMIDMETEPASFRADYLEAYHRWFGDDEPASDNTNRSGADAAYCGWRPNSPRCQDDGD